MPTKLRKSNFEDEVFDSVKVKELEIHDGSGGDTRTILRKAIDGRIQIVDIDAQGVETEADMKAAGVSTDTLDTIAEIAAAIGNNPNYSDDMEASNINTAAALIDIQNKYLDDHV